MNDLEIKEFNSLKKKYCKLKRLYDKLVIRINECCPIGPVLTAFNVSSSTGDACLAPDLSPFDTVFYHNGAGEYPVIGDTVYTNAGGTILFEGTSGNEVQMDNLEYIRTGFGVPGIMEEIACK